MEKIYKHKKTGLQAYRQTTHYVISPMEYKIPAAIVENSDDWEPINDFLFTTFDRIEIRDPSDRVYRVNPDGTKGFIPAEDALKEVRKDIWDGITRYYRNAYSADEYAQTLRKPPVILTTEDGVVVTDRTYHIFIATKVADKWWAETSTTYNWITAGDYNMLSKSFPAGFKAFSSAFLRDTWIAANNPPKVILTTEDGIDITDPNTALIGITSGNFYKHTGVNPRMYANNHYVPMKLFHSEAKADEYILYNKPLLSVGDVVRAEGKIHDSCNFSNGNRDVIKREFNKLRELAKSKLK